MKDEMKTIPLRRRCRNVLNRCRADGTRSVSEARAQPVMTDAQAMEILKRMHCGDRRSTFAQALFPFDRNKYGGRGEWMKAVGTRVAQAIRQNPELRLKMHRLGYVPGKTGYTLEQRITLVKFFS